MYRIQRRQTVIKPYQLAAWYKAIMRLENEVICDYLLCVLFSGLRRNEAAKLEKDHIDLENKTLVIGDPKNHQIHTLPLSNCLCELLRRRIQASPNQYVFPGEGKQGYIIKPRKQIAKIVKSTSIQFTVHDLHRTFMTVAESLDIPAYALKRLINHKMSNDITAGYIVTDIERLRKPMQQITDYLLHCMAAKSKKLHNHAHHNALQDIRQ